MTPLAVRRISGTLGWLLLASWVLGSCRKDSSKEIFAQAPVILISIDTLRSDRLPAYGYRQVETPAIDRLRQESILFLRAYSHYPLTLPSHVSMFTGRLPGIHGVRDNMGYVLDTSKHATLPRLLAEAGYRTGGFVSSFVLRGASGVAAGFETYEDAIETGSELGLGGVQRRGDETLALALEWLDRGDSRPPFLFFHIYEPHTPWDAPEPFRSRFQDPYDAEVAAADAIVGGLLDALRERGLFDRSLVLLVSDHGEGLGDHGEVEHGILLYREVLQVPLLLKLPGGRRGGETVSASAQLVDLLPTVLTLLGLPVPGQLEGRPLLEIARTNEERTIYSETWYPRLHMGWNELTSLVRERHHFIHGPDPELYDLIADPAETRNLREQERRLAAELKGLLAPFQVPLSEPAQVDAETRARLAALGYLGSTGPVAQGPLPDPKAKIHLFKDLGDAHVLLQQGRTGDSIALLERLLEENPRMHDAWVTLGHAHERQGLLQPAIAAYRRALDLSGPVPHLLSSLATLYLELGDLAAAEEHARLARQQNPAWGHQKLAEVWFVRRDLERAEQEARQAVRHGGRQLGPRIVLALVLLQQDRLEEAREVLREAEAEVARRSSQKPPSGYHLIRGDYLARRGELPEAVVELRKELELHPERHDASVRLAWCLTALGRGAEGIEVLRRMVERRPTPAAYAAAVEALELLGDPNAARRLLEVARSRFPDAEQLRSRKR